MTREWTCVREADTIPELGRRVAFLEAHHAIKATLYAPAHAIDYGDETALADTFTQDSVFEVVGPGQEVVLRLQGNDELRLFISGPSQAPSRWHKHRLGEPGIAPRTTRRPAIPTLCSWSTKAISRAYAAVVAAETGSVSAGWRLTVHPPPVRGGVHGPIASSAICCEFQRMKG
ncbi:nuclear transport factor 2 family protein [Pseudarthrobacter sp. fls2-241-R2A-168]|uniref:nuclear transport factor 2 family protein n=1 Tax=Pseudarthrobacter sp. fls2-241-R2A-168 TaxID=3040304 RepID=UPI003305BA7E